MTYSMYYRWEEVMWNTIAVAEIAYCRPNTEAPSVCCSMGWSSLRRTLWQPPLTSSANSCTRPFWKLFCFFKIYFGNFCLLLWQDRIEWTVGERGGQDQELKLESLIYRCCPRGYRRWQKVIFNSLKIKNRVHNQSKYAGLVYTLYYGQSIKSHRLWNLVASRT